MSTGLLIHATGLASHVHLQKQATAEWIKAPALGSASARESARKWYLPVQDVYLSISCCNTVRPAVHLVQQGAPPKQELLMH